uniref:Uncharacterized protein n=1 Tax=Sphaerodactylus townsendi TaxID=933632 RepID=A0ACB8E6H5_9SAUR
MGSLFLHLEPITCQRCLQAQPALSRRMDEKACMAASVILRFCGYQMVLSVDLINTGKSSQETSGDKLVCRFSEERFEIFGKQKCFISCSRGLHSKGSFGTFRFVAKASLCIL